MLPKSIRPRTRYVWMADPNVTGNERRRTPEVPLKALFARVAACRFRLAPLTFPANSTEERRNDHARLHPFGDGLLEPWELDLERDPDRPGVRPREPPNLS